MKQKSATANADDARIAFLSTPAIRELLENRERVTGGGRFVWDRETIADRPAYVSTDVPAAIMICGDFGNVYVGIWGEGFQKVLRPFFIGGKRAEVGETVTLPASDATSLSAIGRCAIL